MPKINPTADGFSIEIPVTVVKTTECTATGGYRTSVVTVKHLRTYYVARCYDGTPQHWNEARDAKEAAFFHADLCH